MSTLEYPFSDLAWSETMKHNHTPVLQITAHRPQFSTNGKAGRIERYFSHFWNQLKEYWKANLYPRACKAFETASENKVVFTPWHAELDYEVTLFVPPLVSIRLNLVHSTSNPYPFKACFGETWDCSTGYPRTLRSLFPPHEHKWKKQLLDKLKEQATQQLASGESLLDANCTQVMERTFDPTQFYLTQEGLAVFYPLCILGSHAEGIPVFTIPYQTFSLIQKDYVQHP